MDITVSPVAALPRREAFQSAALQLQALLSGENDLVANLANASALIHQLFGWHWVGFYLIKNDELVLGPFQGPVACTRIGYGKGVCGTAWETLAMINVPDVEAFPGHIACSSLSKSEIVFPLMVNGECLGILDIDSEKPNDFSEADEQGLADLCAIIGEAISRGLHA